MSGLSIHALSVRYGKREVLSDLSAGPLARGEITALLAPSGSGKSGALRLRVDPHSTGRPRHDQRREQSRPRAERAGRELQQL
ncbi:hypothetical protein [Paraburkholderia sp. CNPSo 3281]|uniref:hypothetical protein n=1 Tax=Paraburkholderia sp. CNPSo 3281 TaxID=2940933 RepID=UPI0020B6B728|nr:hypothetical protein [Paraburkholderia sp. CNPSo 3281]MCP3715243.1 hypothetical protein [Paraburkholderia sp. CNPSo 3281]